MEFIVIGSRWGCTDHRHTLQFPGCIPETEPDTFDDFAEARQCLAERLSTFADEEHESGSEAREEAFDNACAEVMGWKVAAPLGDCLGVFAGGYLFKIRTTEVD